jgi:putative PIN family toxin of toxin-antitoxin system
MKEIKKKRLVVDANIWVSSLLSQDFQVRTGVFFLSENLLLTSKALFNDLDNALRKPYLTKRIILADYEELITKLRTDAELVDVHSIVEVCRDPKDNFLLALAKDGNADYLITGDADLRVIKEFEKTKIVTLSEFMEQI